MEEEAHATDGMEPEEALHWHILRRKKEGVEDQIDRAVDKIGAVPTLNEVLLPAMKEVGDKFGAGELILPFVLQSATVMKRAVAQLEKYLDKIEGYTKGTVVLATVFGDVHDIGKSLVNTILTNNGYTVVDLGKQVPISQIIDAAVEHNATAIGLSALLVSTSKQMPICVAELHERGLEYPVLVGGAAINRDFGRRILYPKGQESDEIYEPGVYYCKDAFQGLSVMDNLIDQEARNALIERFRREAQEFREKPVREEEGPAPDAPSRSALRTDVAIPSAPFWGVREVPVEMSEVFPLLDTHVLFKLHWGGKGVKGEAWERLIEDDFGPRLERMWREQDYLQPARGLRLLPGERGRRRARVLRPRGPVEGDRAPAVPAPARPRPALPGRLLAADRVRRARRVRAPGGHGRPRGDRALRGARGRGRVRRAAVRPRAGRADRRGHRRVAQRARAQRARHRTRPGPPLLVGLPGLPGPGQHVPVFRMLGAESIGLTLSHGFAVEPEQSTVAIVVAPPAGQLLRHEERPHPAGPARARAGSGGEVVAVPDDLGGPYPGRRLRRRELLDRDHPSRPSLACACFAARRWAWTDSAGVRGGGMLR